MTHVWEVHVTVVALVWAWSVWMILATINAMQRGAFFHMIPETIVMAIAYTGISTFAVRGLQGWLEADTWRSLWVPRLVLVLTHVVVLIASGIGALATSGFIRPIVT